LFRYSDFFLIHQSMSCTRLVGTNALVRLLHYVLNKN
jgi:hypothetical protein